VHQDGRVSKQQVFSASFSILLFPLLLAACSRSATSPPATQPGGVALNNALSAWADFPVAAKPRPFILMEGKVLDPVYGFPSDDTKAAYGNGQINPPSTWPSSPSTSMGFPVVGAEEAFKVLTTPTPSIGSPAVPALDVTNIQLGTGRFLTDRGYKVLPAWLFSLAGIQNPAEVLALNPAAIYSAPVTHNNVSPARMSATIGSSDRNMTLNVSGSPEGTGPCEATYSTSLMESKEAIAVAIDSQPHIPAGASCALSAQLIKLPVVLKSAIGSRVVVDAATKGAVTVQGGFPG